MRTNAFKIHPTRAEGSKCFEGPTAYTRAKVLSGQDATWEEKSTIKAAEVMSGFEQFSPLTTGGSISIPVLCKAKQGKYP